MSSNRIQNRLGSEKSKSSVNNDTSININLEGNIKLLPPDVINKVVNVDERFNLERQSSSFYRILGNINPIISNSLFNLDDSIFLDKFTWKGFNYSDSSTNEFRFGESIYSDSIQNNLQEKDGWFGYYDPETLKNGLCNYFDMEPKRNRFTFTPDINPYSTIPIGPIKNWELTITYPASMDNTHFIVNNGLLIVDMKEVNVSGRLMTALGMPCLHNLNVGDLVRITGTSIYDGDHVVIRTGLDNGELQPYYFVIDLPPTGSISQLSRMKRLFGGVESEYYFRKFRKIKTRNTQTIEEDDYEIYKLAFSENAYSDEITQFVFNEDINVSGLTDNLGRPLSEIYLTIIKTNSNNIFTNISSGIETPFINNLKNSSTTPYLLNVPCINKIHNGGNTSGVLPFPSHTPLENNIQINDNEFYGDVAEYNSNQLVETILGEVVHRFNTVNRETAPSLTFYINLGTNIPNYTPPLQDTINLGPRHEGYFYKPHHLIKIREFSSYIEEGDDHTIAIPDYKIKRDDGTYVWRDLLDIGFNDLNDETLNFPFLNGCHYIFNNICFTLRRQDPFNNWGLYYSDFPSDPIGESITTKFNTNSAQDIC